ncbi:helix-turn-helix transcriptional regulator [Geomonas agri]|uniref:helix-turn-helix transcriptional regulator n=1 Tax=Geomonas agri TaxID=2873702 RepID=UPI001CD3A5E7|nr:AlpA family phage regulatory protein [Geomonas agri]
MHTAELNYPATCRLLRLKEVLTLIPVCKSSWWAGVKSGKYPASVKLGPRTTAWRYADILKLIETVEEV